MKRHRDRIDVVEVDDGFLLVIGDVVLCLDREVAEELAVLLADAIETDVPLGGVRLESN
jgi:hypothetical protein